MISNKWKKIYCLILSGLLAVGCAACGGTNTNNANPSAQSAPPGENPVIRNPNNDGATKDSDWIPLTRVAESLGLRLKETDNTAQLGYTDVMYQVHPSQRTALSFGKQVSLSDAPVRQNGTTCMTARALGELLQTDVQKDGRTGELRIGSLDRSAGTKGGGLRTAAPQTGGYNRMNILSLPANRSELVSYAKQFLGVPYEFGAAAYEQSKTFDCSSFTRHVFKRYGISLPRLARDQAELGTSVERANLQTGDLIFFKVPGRFDNDKIPGHVGIYIGDGKFIHTWGDPGVEVSSLDTGYWHNMILSMRRIQ
ncbi:NlpC/P60 family protein [Paenibacillus sp. M1]|uniref:NlpC/P60 family protein n=1 Tax=Paenibacillus haidiansis TaxID=1574488 RepID=A0ABU7VPG9_9BACL